MITNGRLYVALFFLSLGIYGFIQSVTFGHWEATALPASVSGVISILAAVEVTRELRRKEERRENGFGPLPDKPRAIAKKAGFIVTFAWTASFMIAIYLLGFRIAVPLFAFSYLKWRGRGFIVSVAFALVSLGFIYGIFELALGTPIFRGLIFGGH